MFVLSVAVASRPMTIEPFLSMHIDMYLFADAGEKP